MSVTLNPVALKALLETEDGPVGRFVAEVAARVTAQAQANVRRYYVTAPTLDVDQDIDFEMEGSTAIVGIRDAGGKARHLAHAQSQGRINWLTSAVEAGR